MLPLLCFYPVLHSRRKDAVIIGTMGQLGPSCAGAWVPWYCAFVRLLVPIYSAFNGFGGAPHVVWICMAVYSLLIPFMWRYHEYGRFWYIFNVMFDDVIYFYVIIFNLSF